MGSAPRADEQRLNRFGSVYSGFGAALAAGDAPWAAGAALRGASNRLADARIGTAAADVGKCRDLLLARARARPQQRGDRHDEPRLAIAAHRHLLGEPGLLHRMRAVGWTALRSSSPSAPSSVARSGRRSSARRARRRSPCRRRNRGCRSHIWCRSGWTRRAAPTAKASRDRAGIRSPSPLTVIRAMRTTLARARPALPMMNDMARITNERPEFRSAMTKPAAARRRPIVFLHGVGSDKSVWQPAARPFRHDAARGRVRLSRLRRQRPCARRHDARRLCHGRPVGDDRARH